MKNILNIAFCFATMCAFAGLANAQAKTVKGYFCSFTESDSGNLAIRYGNQIIVFQDFADEKRHAKYIGVKSPYQLKVGSEVIVTYVVKKKWGSYSKMPRIVRFTGKINSRIRPCGEED